MFTRIRAHQENKLVQNVFFSVKHWEKKWVDLGHLKVFKWVPSSKEKSEPVKKSTESKEEHFSNNSSPLKKRKLSNGSLDITPQATPTDQMSGNSPSITAGDKSSIETSPESSRKKPKLPQPSSEYNIEYYSKSEHPANSEISSKIFGSGEDERKSHETEETLLKSEDVSEDETVLSETESNGSHL
eukprot:Sdes_comp19972_c0_seq3m12539